MMQSQDSGAGSPDGVALSAPWTMRFTYSRTYGPIVGQFIAGLAEKRILGMRASDGLVFVPPTGYDPRDSSALSDWAEVSTIGTVTACAWVENPAEHHPFSHPFGWAQVRLDGANSDMTHFVVGERGQLKVGSRVTARWATELTGTIRDLSHFGPLDAPDSVLVEGSAETELVGESPRRPAINGKLPETVEGTEVPIEVDYEIYAGFAMSNFLRGLQDGRLIGARAPGSDIVYVPPVGVCPLTLKATTEAVRLGATATLITYIIVHIPVRDKSIPLPYACGDILLDGADTPFLGLIQGVDTAKVRRGMRLRAVLRAENERDLDTSAISHFEPIDEPDVDVEALVAARRDAVRKVYKQSLGERSIGSRDGSKDEATDTSGGSSNA